MPIQSQPGGRTTHASIFMRMKTDDRDRRELSWQEFHSRYAPVIAGFARNLGVRRDLIDDVIQEVLLGFFNVTPTFVYDPTKGKFRGYLKTATQNSIRKVVGPVTPTLDPQSELPDPNANDPVWDKEWGQGVLLRALAQVRGSFEPRTIEAFELNVIRNMKADQVAARLGMTIDGIYKAKERVSRALRTVIGQIHELEG